MISSNQKISIKASLVKKITLKWLLSVVFVFIFPNANAATVLSEIVWVEYVNEQHHLYFSRYDGEVWTEVGEPIYSSDQALTGPALGTDSFGHKILIWTEQLKLKTVLMSMTTVDKSSAYDVRLDWSKAELFSGDGVENFAPSIVFDGNDDGWVFWSSARAGGVSNIFLAKYVKKAWSNPVKVNLPNNVPDFSPIASINQSGDVVVEWNTYDSKLGGYLLDSRVYIVENSAEMDINDEKSLADIQLPGFLPNNQRVFIHFPINRMEQSIPVN